MDIKKRSKTIAKIKEVVKGQSVDEIETVFERALVSIKTETTYLSQGDTGLHLQDN